MTTVKRIVAAALLGAGACGFLAACSATPPGPTYTDAELRAMCERAGGWWRGDLLPGYCEPQSATMP
jgi:hypothetical protein